MEYEIEIDFTPAYELIISLNAYIKRKYQKNMDLGKAWVDKISDQITPEFNNVLADCNLDLIDILVLLVYHCPGERTVSQYLEWLENLTLEEIINILSPYIKQISVNLKAQLTPYINILSEWNEQYFSKLNPSILEHLTMSSKQWEQASRFLPAADLFEQATSGVRLPSDLSAKCIRLIPQYHLSPMNISYYHDNVYVCLYSCDPISQTPDQLPIVLTRLTHCLGDDTRMRLLHLISQQPRTFTELVELTGVSKSTVHYHLITLRGAGLVYLNADSRNSIYSLRKAGIENLYIQLRSYLGI